MILVCSSGDQRYDVRCILTLTVRKRLKSHQLTAQWRIKTPHLILESNRLERYPMGLKTHELAALPLFADASPAMIDALARGGVDVRFARNEVIFLAGSKPRGWFIVLEGTVRVVRGARGRQHVVHSEGVGGTLAEVPLVENGTHPATGIAATPARCALFSREALEAAIAEHPSIAFLISRRLAARVRALVDRLDDRSAQTIDARLIEFLLTRSESRGSATISLGMTQQELAEELGTVREVVARKLRALTQQSCIEGCGGGRYRIARDALIRMRDAGGAHP
jgi:CRP/FNR family transcriptional regulator, cyclic AMP receptor protein